MEKKPHALDFKTKEVQLDAGLLSKPIVIEGGSVITVLDYLWSKPPIGQVFHRQGEAVRVDLKELFDQRDDPKIYVPKYYEDRGLLICDNAYLRRCLADYGLTDAQIDEMLADEPGYTWTDSEFPGRR